MCGFNDGVNDSMQVVVADGHFELELGEKIHHVLSAAIQFGMAFLPTKTFDFGDGDAFYADLRNGLTYIVELEVFDDGF